MADRQKVCKCGNAVGDLLVRTGELEELLMRVKIEESPFHMSYFKESINYIYGGIGNVEEFCTIDAREEQRHSVKVFDKISKIQETKSSARFYQERNDALNNLNRIKRGIMEKVRKCSE